MVGMGERVEGTTAMGNPVRFSLCELGASWFLGVSRDRRWDRGRVRGGSRVAPNCGSMTDRKGCPGPDVVGSRSVPSRQLHGWPVAHEVRAGAVLAGGATRSSRPARPAPRIRRVAARYGIQPLLLGGGEPRAPLPIRALGLSACGERGLDPGLAEIAVTGVSGWYRAGNPTLATLGVVIADGTEVVMMDVSLLVLRDWSAP
jgi:hypothetical protein